MKRLKIITTIVFSTISFNSVYSQETMTLKQCMEYAIENNTKIKSSIETTNQSQIERRDAILSAFTPSITASFSEEYTNGRTPDPETNTYTDIKMFQDAYQLNASIILFDGFRAVNNLKISKTAIKMGKSNEEQQTQSICLATMEAYFNVVYYTKLTDIIKNQVANAEENVRKTKRERELSNKSEIDVLESESQLTELEYKLVNTQNLANNEMIKLKDVMFYPIEKQLNVDTSITGFSQNLDLISAQEIAQYAKENLPEIETYKYQMEKAELTYKTTKWQILPSLQLNAGWYSYHSIIPEFRENEISFSKQIKNNGKKYIGIGLTIPIFNRLSKFSNISKAKSQYKIATYEFDEKQKEIENEVYRAIDDKNGAEKSMLQAKKMAEYQHKTFEINKKKYENGMISALEFNIANEKYLEANASYLNTLLIFYIKNSIVKYYQGTNYINQL
ncbi:MAG: TolC family protein [Bacteroidales bacterium]|nr:TolC family protein [Bacteroidales bacterium]